MDLDQRHMRRALELARRGAGLTSPNPMVGAVIADGERVIAEGWHEQCGAPHAEARALELAGDAAKGATLYCTLEPCCHRTPEKRTPPCTDKIIAAGVGRVVFAVYDPNPHVAGLGEQTLKQAGIEVTYGVLRDEASLLNEAFFAWIQRKVPYVQLKVASTLDGRVATLTGSSRWITGKRSREEVHRMRMEADAVMVGADTVLRDDPRLTVRHVEGPNPARIVVDTHLRALPGASMIDDGEGPVFALCGRTAASVHEQTLAAKGVEVVVCPTDEEGHIDLAWALRELGQRGITSVLVESGGGLSTALLRRRLVDRLTVFINPSLMGEGIAWLNDLGIREAQQRPHLQCVTTHCVGDDVVITGLLDPARTYGSLRAPGESLLIHPAPGGAPSSFCRMEDEQRCLQG
ncbi:MAG: bifunctional diaminohydroxyphosphoribosylaminopyrimidine deaminase/5-amino-6-(5-phosphoribosylamino)uracil reductase RibD [Spirochaetales bacterium]